MQDPKLKEFAALVKAMRKAQKNYFQYRQAVDLQASKVAEQKVDKALEEMESNQTSLFN